MPASYSPAALKAEIDDDPDNLGYAVKVSAGDDSGVAAILNATTGPGAGTKLVPLPVPTLLQWTVATGIRGNIEQAANTPAHPGYGMCNGIRDMFWGAMGSTHVFDTSDPAISGAGGMLDGMVQLQLMTADQRAQLIGLATVPASRAELLWGSGTVVAVTDVEYARIRA